MGKLVIPRLASVGKTSSVLRSKVIQSKQPSRLLLTNVILIALRKYRCQFPVNVEKACMNFEWCFKIPFILFVCIVCLSSTQLEATAGCWLFSTTLADQWALGVVLSIPPPVGEIQLLQILFLSSLGCI